MTAIETLRDELLRVQQAQGECISDSGYIFNHSKFKYQELTRVAKELKGAIDWMNALYSEV